MPDTQPPSTISRIKASIIIRHQTITRHLPCFSYTSIHLCMARFPHFYKTHYAISASYLSSISIGIAGRLPAGVDPSIPPMEPMQRIPSKYHLSHSSPLSEFSPHRHRHHRHQHRPAAGTIVTNPCLPSRENSRCCSEWKDRHCRKYAPRHSTLISLMHSWHIRGSYQNKL